MERDCVILCAGEIGKLALPQNSFVICADGGLAHAECLGVTPDLIVGDFDSYGAMPAGENVFVHPVAKDETDSFLAAEYGIQRGFRRFFIYGGLGGRFDHTLANVQLLHELCLRGCRGTLFGADGTRMTAITNETLEFDAAFCGHFAVFALSDVCHGVTLENFKFTAQNVSLTNHTSLGASNEFCGKKGRVTVGSGVLLVVWKETVS